MKDRSQPEAAPAQQAKTPRRSGILMLMHPHPSPATAAEYFRLGVETGTLPLDLPIRWADQMIAAFADPPGDLVEVAWCRTAERMTAALNEVDGDRNREAAARWLLRTLRYQLAQRREASEVISAAMHAVEQGGLGEAKRL